MDQFEAPDFSVELKTALGIEQLGIGSEKLRKEIHKRIALNYLDGASQDTKNEEQLGIGSEKLRRKYTRESLSITWTERAKT